MSGRGAGGGWREEEKGLDEGAKLCMICCNVCGQERMVVK